MQSGPKSTKDEVNDLKYLILTELSNQASSSRSSKSSLIESVRSRGNSSAISSSEPSSLEGNRASGVLQRVGSMLIRSSRSSTLSKENEFERNTRLMRECDKVLDKVINAKDISEHDRVLHLNDLKDLYERLREVKELTSVGKPDKASESSQGKTAIEMLNDQSRAALKTIANVISKSEAAMRAEKSGKPVPLAREDSFVVPTAGNLELNFENNRLTEIIRAIKQDKPDKQQVSEFVKDIKQMIKDKSADGKQLYNAAKLITEYLITALHNKDGLFRDEVNKLFIPVKALIKEQSEGLTSSASIMAGLGSSPKEVRIAHNKQFHQEAPRSLKPSTPQANQQGLANSNLIDKPLPVPPRKVDPPAKEEEKAHKPLPVPAPRMK